MTEYTTKTGVIIVKADEPPKPTGPVGKITLDVTIRDTQTGESRVYTETYPANYPTESIDFMWTDGNYGCDCNRYLFFCRAANPPEEEDDRNRHSDNRYAVDLAVIRETGEILCNKGDWDA